MQRHRQNLLLHSKWWHFNNFLSWTFTTVTTLLRVCWWYILLLFFFLRQYIKWFLFYFFLRRHKNLTWFSFSICCSIRSFSENWLFLEFLKWSLSLIVICNLLTETKNIWFGAIFVIIIFIMVIHFYSLVFCFFFLILYKINFLWFFLTWWIFRFLLFHIITPSYNFLRYIITINQAAFKWCQT